MKVKVLNQEYEVIRAKAIKAGQVGFIRGSDHYNGEVVLGLYQGLVNLSNPNQTWIDCPNHWEVELLPPGTIIQLTLEI